MYAVAVADPQSAMKRKDLEGVADRYIETFEDLL